MSYNLAMTNRKRSVWPWIVYPLLAVVLYVLSLGPAYSLVYWHDAQYETNWQSTYDICYAPVLWAAENYSPVYDAYIWYTNWWMSHPML